MARHSQKPDQSSPPLVLRGSLIMRLGATKTGGKRAASSMSAEQTIAAGVSANIRAHP